MPPDQKILVLTPAKNAARFVPGYVCGLESLSYPKELISIGFLESDSADGTQAALAAARRRLQTVFRRVGLWKRDFGYQIPPGLARWSPNIQTIRRSILARSRNHLLFRALDDEDWVLWLDIDVVEYPPDVIERLLATNRDIVQPHCVLDYGGRTFDQNAWRDGGRLLMHDMRDEGPLVPLDAVGGTMLLVHADIHRDGLVFPPCFYGRKSPTARDMGELETEGLGVMARDMGHQCWGMPHLEIRHARE
jgi:hypothetical protein